MSVRRWERMARGPFAVMTVLFFMWGFMTVFNDILIPRFKEAFTLDYFEAMLVQFAFFGAYFIGALLYFLISATAGDPIARIGYKNGVVIGLLIRGRPAAPCSGRRRPSCPIRCFSSPVRRRLGFAMLQIAANPYVTILGPERTASSRLNLAQAFNSVGTTIGPLIGGYLIFQYFASTGAHGAESVKVPYIAFCVVFLFLAAIFLVIHLPHVGEGEVQRGAGALKHPHVILGVLAIFMYVGGEVSIGSSIINFLGLPSVAGLDPVEASKYVSLFWGGMLIGRFMGAVELSEMKQTNKQIALAAIPIAGIRRPRQPARLGHRDELPAAARAVLAAVSVRQGARRAHAADFLGDDRRCCCSSRSSAAASSRCGASSASACSPRSAGRTSSRWRSTGPAFTRARSPRCS
jgi:MFS transporter, FHS family, L-fucose permease